MTYNKIIPGGGDTGTLLNLNKRLTFIQNHLDIHGKKILDCGCGTGLYLQALLNCGADAYGIEFNNEKVIQFKQKCPGIADRVNNGNIEAMEFADATFDYALVNEVLEHVSNEAKALREIHRVLKPDGSLIIFSPNRLYPFELHSVSLKNSNRIIPIYIPFIPYIPLELGQLFFNYSARNYWPYKLRQLVRNCGFVIRGTDYIWQTFENISGVQPKVVTFLKPFLRSSFSFLEHIPIIKMLGVSQVIIAQK